MLLDKERVRSPWSSPSSYSRLQTGGLPPPSQPERRIALARWLACLEIDARIGQAIISIGAIPNPDPRLSRWVLAAVDAFFSAEPLPAPPTKLTAPACRGRETRAVEAVTATLCEAQAVWQIRYNLFVAVGEVQHERTDSRYERRDGPSRTRAEPFLSSTNHPTFSRFHRAWILLVGATVVAVISIFGAFELTRKPAIVGSITARFIGDENRCYFVWVTNTTESPLEVTHVWFQNRDEQIAISLKSRPMPKRLLAKESWAVWLPKSRIPEEFRENAFSMFNARFSTGEILAARKIALPKSGGVFGGKPLDEEATCEPDWPHERAATAKSSSM